MNKITEIPAYQYEGYLWYSDEERPVFISDSRPFKKEDLSGHPFVVEGALFSKDKNISITIRNLDGKYLIHQFDLNDITPETYQTIDHEWFVAKDQARKAQMVEVWQLEEDEHELCAKMPSFRPAFWIFKGFTK